jgi:DNA processing protein
MSALEQNREVFAAPTPLFTGMDGGNRLIRSGATLVTSVDDVLADLAPILGLSRPAQAPPAEPPADVSGPELALLAALQAEPRPLDEICDRAGVEPSSALVYLLQLEFRGLVRQLAGMRFGRI